MTVQEAFDNFILSRRLADLSEKTIVGYQQFVAPFLGFVGCPVPLQDVTQADINKYIAGLLYS